MAAIPFALSSCPRPRWRASTFTGGVNCPRLSRRHRVVPMIGWVSSRRGLQAQLAVPLRTIWSAAPDHLSPHRTARGAWPCKKMPARVLQTGCCVVRAGERTPSCSSRSPSRVARQSRSILRRRSAAAARSAKIACHTPCGPCRTVSGAERPGKSGSPCAFGWPRARRYGRKGDAPHAGGKQRILAAWPACPARVPVRARVRPGQHELAWPPVQVLNRIEKRLLADDLRLGSLFAVFSRLTREDAMPAAERIEIGPRRRHLPPQQCPGRNWGPAARPAAAAAPYERRKSPSMPAWGRQSSRTPGKCDPVGFPNGS